MAKTKIAEYEVSLDDQATAIYNRFVSAVESGSVDISKAMGAATSATRAHGAEVNRVTEYIRKERAEQREHNFIYRQGIETVQGLTIGIAAFSNTIGQSSPKLQAFTNVLNTGFITFQGLNNLVGLMGLGGPWGIAIATVGALGVAFSQLSQHSLEYKKTLGEIKDLEIAAGRKPLATQYEEAAQALKRANDEYRRLNTLVQTFEGNASQATTPGAKPRTIITKYIGTGEERAAAYADVLKLEATVKTLNEQLNKIEKAESKSKPVAKQVVTQAKEAAEYVRYGLSLEEKMLELSRKFAAAMDSREKKRLAVHRLTLEYQNTIRETAEQMNALDHVMQDTTSNFTNALSGEATQAIRNLFGEANSLLEQFVEAALLAITRIAAEAAAAAAVAGIFSLLGIGGGFGKVFNFLTGGMFGGDRANGPVGVVPAGAASGGGFSAPQGARMGGGATIVIHNYGPIADEEAFMRIMKKATRKTGLPFDRLLADTRNTLVIS